MTTMSVMSGVRFRPYRGEPDLVDIVRIENAEMQADGVPRRASVGTYAAEFAHPGVGFVPQRDVTLVEADGAPVAFQVRSWVDTTDGLREHRLDGAVDPAWRRRGIGTALLAEGEHHSRDLAVALATNRPLVLGSWSGDSQAGDAAALSAAGFAPVRWFFQMRASNLDDVEDVPLPDGFTVRPITRDLALAVWRADVEAFQDHWGGFDGSDERLEDWLARPSTDMSMWLVAFEGDEVAGGVINAIDAAENAALGVRRGWLNSVFTRRAWRRRGLAAALIARSLVMLRERGMTAAVLGVDADNPTGALGLYERAGFEVAYRSSAWRKAMTP
jgi:mycothiol synthase